jgi:hypothetical protein
MIEIFVQSLLTLAGLIIGAVVVWIRTSPQRKLAAAQLAEAQAKLAEAQQGRATSSPPPDRSSSPDSLQGAAAWGASFPASYRMHPAPWDAPIKALRDDVDQIEGKLGDIAVTIGKLEVAFKLNGKYSRSRTKSEG